MSEPNPDRRRRPADDGPRWPSWVYGDGEEPDPRFTLANERTFLAWVRTAVASAALGYALIGFSSSRYDAWAGRALLLVAAGGCVLAWCRWARIERALRHARPLPSPAGAPWLGVLLAAVLLTLCLEVLR